MLDGAIRKEAQRFTDLLRQHLTISLIECQLLPNSAGESQPCHDQPQQAYRPWLNVTCSLTDWGEVGQLIWKFANVKLTLVGLEFKQISPLMVELVKPKDIAASLWQAIVNVRGWSGDPPTFFDANDAADKIARVCEAWASRAVPYRVTLSAAKK